VTKASRVEVDGADMLASTMHRAAGEIEELDQAQQAAGRLVEQRARSGAPRLTGDLSRSIRASVTGTEVHVSSDLPRYPGVQEYGSTHTPAHPYMRPALGNSSTQIVALYEIDVQRALGKVKGA
jgi:HK97 gp10 family phage protein